MLKFDAPIDFNIKVWEDYTKWMPVARENKDVTVWVVDPSGFYVGEQSIDKYKNLKVLATPSTGSNHVDLDTLAKRNIKFFSLLDNRKGLDTISASAEFTFKLLLDAMRMPPAKELQGKEVGLIGYGRIGKRMERYCEAFGASVIINDPKYPTLSMPLETMFEICDAIVVCCTLNGQTKGLIGRELLTKLKYDEAFVNTARGEIVDEDALVDIMSENPSLRVAVDVIHGLVDGTAQPERLKSLGAIVTNHIAGATFDSRTKAAQIILDLLKGYKCA